MASDRPTLRGRLLERTITLTDAVVAIAMTLLVLPLVDQVAALESGDLAAGFADEWHLFVSFVISFLVIHVFWSAHEDAFSWIDELHPRLRSLNMWWLLLIAFLPFPTARVGKDATTATVPLYIGTMFVLSVLTAWMSVVAERSSIQPDVVAGRTARRTVLTWSTPAVFALCTAVGAVNAEAGLLGLLLLIVVRVVEVVGPGRPAEGTATSS